MRPTRKVSRRSFLGSVAGGVFGGGALTLIAGRAQAFQVTDRDTGVNADPVGRGRGGTGITDSDSGVGADPAGRGRGNRLPPNTGITDSDTGAVRDPAGRGRGSIGRTPSGVTDSDGGPTADPVGRGRGGRAPGQQGANTCQSASETIAQIEDQIRDIALRAQRQQYEQMRAQLEIQERLRQIQIIRNNAAWMGCPR